MLEKFKVMLLGACLLCTLTIGKTASAQSKTTVPPQVKEVYGSAAAQISAEQLLWLQDQLSRSLIRKQPFLNGEQIPLLSSLPLMDKFVPGIQADDFSKPLAINPLKYYIDFFNPADQLFRIDGTDYVLIVAGHKAKHN